MISNLDVRRITYTRNTNVREESQMYPRQLIVEAILAERRREAKANRMLRQDSLDPLSPPTPSWPTRARLWLGNTLVAVGETLRSSSRDHSFDRAA